MFFTTKPGFVPIAKMFLMLFLLSCFFSDSFAQQQASNEDLMVEEFYRLNGQQLRWFSANKNLKNATRWLDMMKSGEDFGIITNKPRIDKIQTAIDNHRKLDILSKVQIDSEITGLVLNFLKELQEGTIKLEYDEVSLQRDSVYLHQLLDSKPRECVSGVVEKLETKDHDYQVLKNYLNDSISPQDTLKYKTIILAMNYRRYLTVNQQPEYILVNIPTTEAEYYRDGRLMLKMRTVVGRKSNSTPVLASYTTKIVTFPLWNVPYSIAVNEILPKVKKNESYLEQHDFEVVDAKGNFVDDSKLNWDEYNEKNFPYFFQQSTGADNSLGVLKFEMQNPFSIFLHATSWQGAFTQENRFLSHGCIRLEKPFELADALLRGAIDMDELKSGKKNTESATIKLSQKVPTFLIYSPVKVNGQQVTFLKDVYKLIK